MGQKAKSPKGKEMLREVVEVADIMEVEGDVLSSSLYSLEQLVVDSVAVEAVVEGVVEEEQEESQTLLEIRREVLESLKDGSEAEEPAPPSSQPRPPPSASDQESANEDESFDGEYSYADLSENFSAADDEGGEIEVDLEGIDLEGFEYDPEDREFLEEVLAVAPEGEKEILRRLSQCDIADKGKAVVEEVTPTTDIQKIEAYARTLPAWNLLDSSKRKATFNRPIVAYAVDECFLMQDEAIEAMKAVMKIWENEKEGDISAWKAKKEEEKKAAQAKLLAKKTAVEKAGLSADVQKIEAYARTLPAWNSPGGKVKAVFNKPIVAFAMEQCSLSQHDATEAMKVVLQIRKGEKEGVINAVKVKKDEEKTALKVKPLAKKNAANQKDRQENGKAPMKRKRADADDEAAVQNEVVPTKPLTKAEAALANPTLSKTALKKMRQQQAAQEKAAKSTDKKLQLVNSEEWYAGETGKATTAEVKQPPKKRTKKGPVVSSHFGAVTTKVEDSAAAVPTANLDVEMEDAPETEGDALPLVGTTADDEDRPIVFSSGAGGAVEGVLRTPIVTGVKTPKPVEKTSKSVETIAPAEQAKGSRRNKEPAQPQPAETKVLSKKMQKKLEKQLANEANRQKQLEAKKLKKTEKVIDDEARLKQTEIKRLKQMVAPISNDPIAQIARAAREAVWAAEKTVKDTVAANAKNPAVLKLQPKVPDGEGRVKRKRNKNRISDKATDSNATTLAVEDKVKSVVDAATDRDNNDPVIVAERLAAGLHANGKRKRNRVKKAEGVVVGDVAMTDATQESTAGALAIRANTNSEKPSVVETSKDHHS